MRSNSKNNNVTANIDGMSRVAGTITTFGDDAVELDNNEKLLVNHKKKSVFSKAETLLLQDITSANKSTLKNHNMSFDPFNSYDSPRKTQPIINTKA
ncbi:hypothetical protein NX790_08505 [Enterobacter asburiae]|uniref:hypothetical protein n=1 Tax=Enterobacter asburiae TaxID=61645 RepID=UPI0021760763|nr:hypothetical protein [Enterobacter asburiae]MCS5454451.1 hypothetical protein [Enterobacter asburiae]